MCDEQSSLNAYVEQTCFENLSIGFSPYLESGKVLINSVYLNERFLLGCFEFLSHSLLSVLDIETRYSGFLLRSDIDILVSTN